MIFDINEIKQMQTCCKRKNSTNVNIRQMQKFLIHEFDVQKKINKIEKS